MDTLILARSLMGLSLAFHIIYAAIGVGLTLLLAIAEGLALRTGDEDYHRMARAWTRPAAVLFAIGGVSGTILSFEFGLLWPRMIAFAGGIIGLPFALEAFAFFLEAIFMALYLYGTRRLTRRVLFLTTLPIAVSAAISDFFVISVNAWMNTPAGFGLTGSQLTSVSPWQAMFNPATAHEVLHGTMANYIAVGLLLAGIYAWGMLHGQQTAYNRKALSLALALAIIVLPIQAYTGDWAARTLAEKQPRKLAAMEALFKTTSRAPLTIGGWPDPSTEQVYLGLRIPKALSILAYFDPDATVQGLDAFPPDTIPDPRMVHPPWNLMLGLWALMIVAAVWFWWWRWRRRQKLLGRRLLWALVVASPMGILAIECGWLTTEFGRQPYVAQGYMKVADAVTAQSGLGIVFVAFAILYIALTAGLLRLLRASSATPTDKPVAEEESYGA